MGSLNSIQSIGIVGAGSFGMFIAKAFANANLHVLIHDRNHLNHQAPGLQCATLEETASCDVILLAIPIQAYKALIPKLQKTAKTDALIVDICSVKMTPHIIFEKYGLFARQNVLMTHPLFGPQSAANGLAGKKIVITKMRGSRAEEFTDLFESFGLEIIPMTAEDHDREMATVHALTSFLGRGLLQLNLPASAIDTNYSHKLRELIDIEQRHSQELFETMQLHNPYARQVREELLASLQSLHQNLQDDVTVRPTR